MAYKGLLKKENSQQHSGGMAYIRKIWKYLPKKRNEMLLRATRKIDMRLPYEAISSCCQNDGHTVCSFAHPRKYSVFAFNGISTESFLLRIFPRKIKNLFFISELLFSSVCAQPLVNVKYLRFYLQKYTLFFRRLLYSESHKFIWYIYPRSSKGNWSKAKNMIKIQQKKNTHTNCWENEIIASTQHVCVVRWKMSMTWHALIEHQSILNERHSKIHFRACHRVRLWEASVLVCLVHQQSSAANGQYKLFT